MIAVGSKVKLNEESEWLAENYNLTIGKEYEVIKTSEYWESATIVNDTSKKGTLNVNRFDLVSN